MKIPNGIRYYAIVTQYGVLLAALTYGGYKLGNYLSDGVLLSGMLGVFGSFLGLALLVYNIRKAQIISDKNGKKEKKK